MKNFLVKSVSLDLDNFLLKKLINLITKYLLFYSEIIAISIVASSSLTLQMQTDRSSSKMETFPQSIDNLYTILFLVAKGYDSSTPNYAILVFKGDIKKDMTELRFGLLKPTNGSHLDIQFYLYRS